MIPEVLPAVIVAAGTVAPYLFGTTITKEREKPMKKIHVPHMLAALLAVVAILAVALVVDTSSARADGGRPYGGCKEVLQDWPAYEDSPGTQWCNRHGWTIRHRFALDPTNRVRMLWLQPCKYEDSRGCYWNAATMGNGSGASFIRTKQGRTFWVRFPANIDAELVGV